MSKLRNLRETIKFYTPSLEQLASMIPRSAARTAAAALFAATPLMASSAEKSAYDPSLTEKVTTITLPDANYPGGKVTIEVPTQEARDQYINNTEFVVSPLIVETARITDINPDKTITGYMTSDLPPSYVPQVNASETPAYPFAGQKVAGTNLWLVDQTADGRVVSALTTQDISDWASINWPQERYGIALDQVRRGQYTELLSASLFGNASEQADRNINGGIVLVTGDYMHGANGNFTFTTAPSTVFVIDSLDSDNDSATLGYQGMSDLIFNGNMNIAGTPQNPIIFTVTDNNASWGGIFSQAGTANLQYSIIESAVDAFATGFALYSMDASHNIIRRSDAGMVIGADGNITSNEMTNNSRGILLSGRYANVHDNIIHDNPSVTLGVPTTGIWAFVTNQDSYREIFNNVIISTGIGLQTTSTSQQDTFFYDNISAVNAIGMATQQYQNGPRAENNNLWANIVNVQADGAETHDYDAANVSVNPDFRNPRIGDLRPMLTQPEGPATLSFNPAQYTVDAGNIATLVAQLSAAQTAAVSAVYTIQAGTALPGEDYIDGTGTVIIPAGVLTAQIPVQTVNDNTSVPGYENFTVNLGNIAGAAAGNIAATVQLYNQGINGPTTISFVSETPIQMVEGSGIDVEVRRAGQNNLRSIVNYTVDQSGRTPAYSGTIEFNEGETSKTIHFEVPQDEIYQRLAQIIGMHLSGPQNASIGISNRSVVVNDDEKTPVLSLRQKYIDAYEADGSAKVEFVLINPDTEKLEPSAEPVIFNINTIDRTAVAANRDYSSVDQAVTIPPYQGGIDVNVAIPQDDFFELPKTFLVTYTKVDGAAVDFNDARRYCTVRIVDDDQPSKVDFGEKIYIKNEGETVDLTVKLDKPAGPGNTLTVSCETIDGMASAENDYAPIGRDLTFTGMQTEQTLQVQLKTDHCKEGLEDLSVRLYNPINAAIGTANNPATIIIKNVYNPRPPFGCNGGE